MRAVPISLSIGDAVLVKLKRRGVVIGNVPFRFSSMFCKGARSFLCSFITLSFTQYVPDPDELCCLRNSAFAAAV